jgi:hypothetical protein
MTPETSEALLTVLATLIDGCNELDVKLTAAERVMLRQSPGGVEDYLLEIGDVKKILNPPAAAQALADLRAKMPQDRS